MRVADIDATIDMMMDLRKAAPRLRWTLGCSTFVPKAHTPFQWYGVRPEAEKRLKRLERVLAREGISLRPESYKWSVIQAVLSRGDRRLGAVLMTARGEGGNKDSLGAFRRALKQLSGQVPSLEYYAHQNYNPEGSKLPWSHLRGPLPSETLLVHLKDAQSHMLHATSFVP